MSETSSPLRVLEGLRSGEVVGGYRIERHIATGGWARVYKAHRLSNGEPYALKTVRPEIAGDPEYQRLFEREQTALRLLRYHANLRPPVDWSREEDGLLWLVMPWIEGPTLRELVSEVGPLSPVEAADLIAKAAEGIDAVHTTEPGLVHRDLHPRNLMIESGQALVIDFGLAKRFEHSSGSPFMPRPGRWSSPEATRGEDLTPQADIYSLGLLLAFALTGAEPDQGPSFPRGITVPRRLRSIISRATESEPSRRYRSAQEFADRLHEFALQARRERRRIAVTGAVAVAALSALAAFFIGSAISADPDPAAEQQLTTPPLSVQVPGAWNAVAVSKGDRGAGLRAGARGEGVEVLMGGVPRQRAFALVSSPQVVEVALPAGRALRIDGLAGTAAERLFVFRAAGRYPVLACRDAGTGSSGWKSACAEVAATATLPEASKLPPHPAPALSGQIARALQRYSRGRRDARGAIDSATERSAVAAAADKAGTAAAAAAKIAGRPQLKGLRSAFGAAADAWRAASRAARDGSKAGFRRAGTAMERAEREIRRAWRRLAALGYRFPVG